MFQQNQSDYYSILNVDERASVEEIKKSYLQLCKELHPDINKAAGAEEKFKLVQEAYATLSCPQQKAHFDSLRGDYYTDFKHSDVGTVNREYPRRGGGPNALSKIESIFARRGLWLVLLLTPVFGLTYLGVSSLKPKDIYQYDPPTERKVYAFFDPKTNKWRKPDLHNTHRGTRNRKLELVNESLVSHD